MKDSHAHLHITEAEWDRMAQIFKQILDKYKVREKEQQELFAIVGTTLALVETDGLNADSGVTGKLSDAQTPHRFSTSRRV